MSFNSILKFLTLVNFKNMKPATIQPEKAAPISSSEILFADVEFGNPRIKCRNFGICRVTVLDRFNETFSPKAACAIILFLNEKVEIRFLKKDMHPDARSKYFSAGFFQIDSPFIFSKEIQERVKFGKFEIPEGKYSITENEDFFILKL